LCEHRDREAVRPDIGTPLFMRTRPAKRQAPSRAKASPTNGATCGLDPLSDPTQKLCRGRADLRQAIFLQRPCASYRQGAERLGWERQPKIDPDLGQMRVTRVGAFATGRSIIRAWLARHWNSRAQITDHASSLIDPR
jgi:hypothetical protein